jgi:hypothetical protein
MQHRTALRLQSLIGSGMVLRKVDACAGKMANSHPFPQGRMVGGEGGKLNTRQDAAQVATTILALSQGLL